MQGRNMVIFFMAGLVGAWLATAIAGELPSPTSKPLSSIIKGVEDQKLGSITEAEFDDGLWEIKVCQEQGCLKLYLNPETGQEQRRRPTHFEETPPANSLALSIIMQSIEARGQGTITEVEFDDGFWEVKLRKDRQKIKLVVDPMTGDTRP